MKANDSRIARQLMGITALVSVFFFTGCEGSVNPQAGDQDAKAARYEVYVPIRYATIKYRFDDTTASSDSFEVSVTCSGKNLPPDCDKNIPNWTYHVGPGAPFITVQFADLTKPSTTAKVIADVQAFRKAYEGSRSSFAAHWFQVSVFPSSLPEHTTLGGKRDFTVDFERTGDPRPREEQDPGEPTLSGAPALLGMSISGTELEKATAEGLLVYSGPVANLVDASIVGPGRSKFLLLEPARPYIFKKGQSSVPFIVSFQTAKDDFLGYDATLIFTTDNNATCTVPLTARRTSF
jgi:hypothetical protein